MEPQDTIHLLKLLQDLGFDDAAFARLHHLREKSKSETIANYCRYCNDDIKSYQPNSNNVLVHRRLEVVLGAYKSGFKSRSPTVFRFLAEAAYEEIPARC